MKFFGVVLGLKNAQFRQGLDEARKDVQRFKAETKAGGGMFGALRQGIAAIGLGALIREIVMTGDKFADLAQRFGISAETLQKFGYVAEQNGSSVEGMAKAINKVTIAQDDALGGNQNLREAFASLGVSMEELQSMSVEQLLLEIGRGSMHASDLVKVLGKSSLELVPTLRSLADGSAEFGRVMSEETIGVLGDLSDNIKQVRNDLMAGLGTALQYVIEKVKDMGKVFGATFSVIEMKLGGRSWEESIDSAKQAYLQMGAEEEDARKKRRERDPKRMAEDGEDDGLAAKRKAVDDEVQRAYEAREEAQVKASNDVQLGRLDAMVARQGMSGMDIADQRRAQSKAAREAARGERAFARKFGADELQRVKDLRDPNKQAEAAFEAAMAGTEGKLEEIKTLVSQKLSGGMR